MSVSDTDTNDQEEEEEGIAGIALDRTAIKHLLSISNLTPSAPKVAVALLEAARENAKNVDAVAAGAERTLIDVNRILISGKRVTTETDRPSRKRKIMKLGEEKEVEDAFGPIGAKLAKARKIDLPSEERGSRFHDDGRVFSVHSAALKLWDWEQAGKERGERSSSAALKMAFEADTASRRGFERGYLEELRNRDENYNNNNNEQEDDCDNVFPLPPLAASTPVHHHHHSEREGGDSGSEEAQVEAAEDLSSILPPTPAPPPQGDGDTDVRRSRFRYHLHRRAHIVRRPKVRRPPRIPTLSCTDSGFHSMMPETPTDSLSSPPTPLPLHAEETALLPLPPSFPPPPGLNFHSPSYHTLFLCLLNGFSCHRCSSAHRKSHKRA